LRDRSVATVVPSECHENSPYAVTEAFNRGCPAIASRAGGLPELDVDGETGLLFEPHDAKGLAWSMRRLSTDPALQRRLSDNARKAADGLGIDEYAPRIVEVYRSVLST
jgi:glycosyltransferase involved in cell wall biosynthesis